MTSAFQFHRVLCVCLVGAVGLGLAGCSAFRPLIESPKESVPRFAVSTSTASETVERESQEEGVLLGRVNGRELYSGALDSDLLGEIERTKSEALQREMHLRWVGFRGLVGESLLEEEAGRLGISRSELIEREVTQRLTRPTKEDVTRLYEANRAQFRGATLEQVQPSLAEHLLVQRREALLEELVERLIGRANIQLEVPVPELPRESLELRDAPFTGPENAPVVVVEFGDYECPYCAKATEVMRSLRELYPSEVKLVYMDFPLERHPFAKVAAEAAHCMHQQGHFWAYHDLLYDNLGATDRTVLGEFATRVGGDRKAFDRCMKSGASKQWVERSMAQARRLGLNATPSIFINGVKLLGLLPLPLLRRIVDKELQRDEN